MKRLLRFGLYYSGNVAEADIYTYVTFIDKKNVGIGKEIMKYH